MSRNAVFDLQSWFLLVDCHIPTRQSSWLPGCATRFNRRNVDSTRLQRVSVRENKTISNLSQQRKLTHDVQHRLRRHKRSPKRQRRRPKTRPSFRPLNGTHLVVTGTALAMPSRLFPMLESHQSGFHLVARPMSLTEMDTTATISGTLANSIRNGPAPPNGAQEKSWTA